jgi:YVTN family beta-propeller protein
VARRSLAQSRPGCWRRCFPPVVAGEPYAIAITPDGKTAYVLNIGSGTVTPIRTATGTAGTPITVGTEPMAIAITR